ncbi:hypothetical protein RRG08_014597 [Elysia crispata]|uniref:Uncharacterized protein n=1 Tax=Elysia crispata TaxID=231223 RepID=A0AAE0Z2S9_9GAST|nr:hypothetical protein RRG08_014597 [Elysia crispata]
MCYPILQAKFLAILDQTLQIYAAEGMISGFGEDHAISHTLNQALSGMVEVELEDQPQSLRMELISSSPSCICTDLIAVSMQEHALMVILTEQIFCKIEFAPFRCFRDSKQFLKTLIGIDEIRAMHQSSRHAKMHLTFTELISSDVT